MIYLTYNDPPSGIYSGQVIDVCKFLGKNFNINIRLVALISLRGFGANRKKIKAELPTAIVLPMFPGVRFWRFNFFTMVLLLAFRREERIIARGPFSTLISLTLRKYKLVNKVIFDARGASFSELMEYNVVESQSVKDEIHAIEAKVVHESDFRLAVSRELVKYWKREYNYNSEDHVVIPCTLHSNFSGPFPSQNDIQTIREKYNFAQDDIVLVFAGSSAEWQSPALFDAFLNRTLTENPAVQVLLLVKDDFVLTAARNFPDRIRIMWLPPVEVKQALLAGDYGFLVREQSVTNQVASPVKFAEYLACGLKVIISDGLGDHSRFVVDHKCGMVVSDIRISLPLVRVSYEEKVQMNNIALKNFSKSNFLSQYALLLR